MTEEFKNVMAGIRRQQEANQEKRAQITDLQTEKGIYQDRYNQLAGNVNTRRAEVETAKTAISAKDQKSMKAFEEAGRALRAAEAELHEAGGEYKNLIAELDEKIGRISAGIHEPDMPYQAAARALLQTDDNVSLFLYTLRHYLKRSVGQGDKIAPRDQIERRLDAGLTDEEAARLFEEWLKKAA